jgi:5-methylcytosine-specific restriction endonuclease McrA
VQSDPEKTRAWRERGARKYAEKRRATPLPKLSAAARKKPEKPSPRRNDGPWRRECIEARGERCRRCLSTRWVQMDHMWPKSQGGPSVVENGLPLCRACHAMKTESRIVIEPDWLDSDQVEWLADVGWVLWDSLTGEPSGRGWKHFAARRVA